MQSWLFFFLFLLSGPVLVTAQPAPEAPVGVQLHTFRHQMAGDVPGTLQIIRDMGFRYIEGGALRGMSIEESKELFDRYGLKVASTGAGFDALADPARWPQIVANAKTLGARYVTCFWIPHEGDDFTAAEVQRAVEVFNTAGRALRKKGLRLLYHPHGYEFRPHGDGYLFDELVRQTDPRYVNFQMDIFWVKHPGQNPVQWLRKYPDRWKALHLKDRAPGTPGNLNGRGDPESNVPLGSGEIDIAGVMKEAKKNGIKYYFIEDESSRVLEQVPVSLEYLRRL